VTASGAMPAKEFIKELDDGDKRKLDVLFRRMAEMGRIFNREQFKQVEGKIYEFKRYQLRIGCFQAEHRWLLTHGFFKKSDKWPKSEIDRAQRIMNEHLQRKTGGSKPERPNR
jgi:phage-related protein